MNDLKDLIELFHKMVWLIGFGVTVCEIFRVKIIKNCWISKTYQDPVFPRDDVLLMVTQSPVAFSERAKYLSDALKCIAQTVTDFLLSSAGNTKISHSWHFNYHNSWSRRDSLRNYPILFYLIFEIFAFQDFQNSIPFNLILVQFNFWSAKYTIICQS